MAISIEWPTGIISVPKADTVLVGTDPISGREIRTFDTEQFHKDLRLEETTIDGRVFDRTHDYEAATNDGAIDYAAKVTINTAYYTVEFENGSYRVVLINTNNNIANVSVINDVSIQPTNSAGLIGASTMQADMKETLVKATTAADQSTQANAKL